MLNSSAFLNFASVSGSATKSSLLAYSLSSNQILGCSFRFVNDPSPSTACGTASGKLSGRSSRGRCLSLTRQLSDSRPNYLKRHSPHSKSGAWSHA